MGGHAAAVDRGADTYVERDGRRGLRIRAGASQPSLAILDLTSVGTSIPGDAIQVATFR
jgi:hypothetical protein